MVVLGAVVLSVPFAGVVWVQRALAESALRGTVSTLLNLTAPLSRVASPPEALADTAELAFDSASDPKALAAGTAKAPSARVKTAAKPQALFVSATAVLQLSKSAARPQGNFVPQTSQHPAGLRLVGVGALGIGVRDGDILIDAMGISPRASGEILGAIIEARARRVRALSGTLWRDGHTFRITVEQPYQDPA